MGMGVCEWSLVKIHKYIFTSFISYSFMNKLKILKTDISVYFHIPIFIKSERNLIIIVSIVKIYIGFRGFKSIDLFELP